MRIKIFTEDRNGNILITKKELEEVLNEAYNEGFYDGNKSKNNCTITTTPGVVTIPYYTWTSSGTTTTLLSNAKDLTTGSVSLSDDSAITASTLCTTNSKGEVTDEVSKCKSL